MVKVTIDQGTLIGKKSETPNGFEYIEFLQIPYAKPPTGTLRFKSPQPPEKWEGERDATQTDENLTGLQYNFFNQSCVGSEDCLYLNVFTPGIPGASSKLLPVMVYIHGGGFVSGNGTIKKFGSPDFFLDKEVVVVTINYRLGFFGFLSLDMPEAAGNMGLKDQTFALKWIQNNINHFGGDKDNVTLFGISAGSASIEYHLLSPSSKGLYHKAIMQSGSVLNSWAINRNIKELVLKTARDLEYKGSDDNYTELYNFFMNKTTDELKRACFVDIKSNSKSLHFGYVPTIEKDLKNGDAFLTEEPYSLLKQGKFNRVPVIRGYCKHEGLLMAIMKPQHIKEMAQTRNFLDIWNYPFNPSESDKYNEKFKELYLEGKRYKSEDDFVIDFFGDYDFITGIWISNKLTVEKGVPAYGYVFSYDGNINYVKASFGIKMKGICHGDDISYTLNVELPKSVIPNETDEIVRNRISKMWTDFAKTGNPTPSTNQLVPVKWPVLLSKTEQQYLIIDKRLEVTNPQDKNKIELFEELLQKHKSL